MNSGRPELKIYFPAKASYTHRYAAIQNGLPEIFPAFTGPIPVNCFKKLMIQS